MYRPAYSTPVHSVVTKLTNTLKGDHVVSFNRLRPYAFTLQKQNEPTGCDWTRPLCGGLWVVKSRRSALWEKWLALKAIA